MSATLENVPASNGLTKKDFVTDQEVRWCPGCGDYAILNAVQQVFPKLGIPREKFVVVAGIGCSSRFPYYMNTYGFHSIHGRAPGIATGIKVANPDLSVWIATGDGDAMSIGGNHLIHVLRRNVDVKILMFNNRIYGLTKGQYSPTSEMGKKTKSTPFGSVDYPMNPISLALGAEATFVARSVDVYSGHLQEILTRAAHHKGAAFIEIMQNCNIFNDKAWEPVVEKEVRDERNLQLVHGKPLIFGKNRDMGIRLNGFDPEVVRLADGVYSEKDLLVYDEKDPNGRLAWILSRINYPEFPVPIGVFKAVERPTFDSAMQEQVVAAKSRMGQGDLEKLMSQGDTWVVS
jgi:2-oxoglutarate ferredoxin oxidoreductase subunit beta